MKSSLPNDTDPEVEAILIAGYQAMSLSQKGPVTIRFASPEDTLLHKLVRYRLGNEASDRQWLDILGVLKVQGDALDREYLDRWASQLEVADLLARARG